jgi:hypothetical protein
LILSSHLGVGFPSGLFPTGLPTKKICMRLPCPHRCHMPRRQRRSYFSNMSVEAVLSFEAPVYFYQTNVVTAMKAPAFLKSSFPTRKATKKCLGWVGNTPALYSESPGFKSRTQGLLS